MAISQTPNQDTVRMKSYIRSGKEWGDKFPWGWSGAPVAEEGTNMSSIH